MAKIVSEKTWIKVSRDELERFIANSIPEGLDVGTFELIEVQAAQDDHRVHQVTFGIKHFIATGHGPLSGPPESPDDLEGGFIGDHLRDDM